MVVRRDIKTNRLNKLTIISMLGVWQKWRKLLYGRSKTLKETILKTWMKRSMNAFKWP